jgi:hypothetical protein
LAPIALKSEIPPCDRVRESRPGPISSGRKKAGNDRRTRGAGQQHPSEPFLVGCPAKHAGSVQGNAFSMCLHPGLMRPVTVSECMVKQHIV